MKKKLKSGDRICISAYSGGLVVWAAIHSGSRGTKCARGCVEEVGAIGIRRSTVCRRTTKHTYFVLNRKGRLVIRSPHAWESIVLDFHMLLELNQASGGNEEREELGTRSQSMLTVIDQDWFLETLVFMLKTLQTRYFLLTSRDLPL